MTTTFLEHWREAPESAWCWPNVSPAEIACRGTGKLLIVRSAYRSPKHNRAVGGATGSKHMDGAVFDIAMSNPDPVAFEGEAE